MAERLFRLDARELNRLQVFDELEDACAREGVIHCGGGDKFLYRFDGSSIAVERSLHGRWHTQVVVVERTACHFGGSRPWLLCPTCGSRVLVLYWHADDVACLRCTGAAHRTQGLDLVCRTWVKQRKIERLLGPDHARPKGMHWTTYLGHLAQISGCQRGRDLDLLTWGRKFPHLWR